MTRDALLPLETGWWPTTPAGDTYLRRFLLNWAGMCAAAAHSLGGHSRDLRRRSWPTAAARWCFSIARH